MGCYATLGELVAPHAGRGRRRIGDLVEKKSKNSAKTWCPPTREAEPPHQSIVGYVFKTPWADHTSSKQIGSLWLGSTLALP